MMIGLMLTPGLLPAQDEPLESNEQRFGYALGFNVGRQWRDLDLAQIEP